MPSRHHNVADSVSSYICVALALARAHVKRITHSVYSIVLYAHRTDHFRREHNNIGLRIEHVQMLHRKFSQWWARFINKLPQAWDPDEFFAGSIPIILSCRYGQNMAIGVDDNAERELQAWCENRTWTKIQQVTFSIATDIS